MRAEVHRRTGFLFSILLAGLLVCFTSQAQPSDMKLEMVASEKLANWTGVTQELQLDGTVAFLSDDRVVVSVCHTRGDLHCLLLVILQVADAGFRPLSKNHHPRPFGSLHMTETGGVLAYPNPWLGFPIELLSAELASTFQI